jgi:hypothetical protein
VRALLIATLRTLLVDHWLGNHHQVTEKKDGGDDIHVFAIEHGTLYGTADKTKTYEVSFHLGPITIRVTDNTLRRFLRRAAYSHFW